jgi:hypothetical protein
MPKTSSQEKILAQGIYEIRILLSGYLGSQNTGDPLVRRAAHLAYALHNEALSIIGDGTFDSRKAIKKIKMVDAIFAENFASKFQPHAPE